MTGTVEWSWTVALVLLGLALVTLGSRGFFLLPPRDVPLPPALRKALRHAPVAALVAVVAPELVMTQGQLVHTWMDARLFAAAAGAAYYHWRRGILGTIVVGMAVLLPLKLGLGW